MGGFTKINDKDELRKYSTKIEKIILPNISKSIQKDERSQSN